MNCDFSVSDDCGMPCVVGFIVFELDVVDASPSSDGAYLSAVFRYGGQEDVTRALSFAGTDVLAWGMRRGGSTCTFKVDIRGPRGWLPEKMQQHVDR